MTQLPAGWSAASPFISPTLEIGINPAAMARACSNSVSLLQSCNALRGSVSAGFVQVAPEEARIDAAAQ